MISTGKKAVIFDLFGTLCGATSPENIIISEFELLSNVHPALQRAVCGAKFDGDWTKYLSGIAQAAGIRDNLTNRATLHGIIDRELLKADVVPGAVGVLRRLAGEGYVLGLVSNAYPLTRQRILECKRLIDCFPDPKNIVLSYEVGFTKQGPEIYQEVIRRVGVPAERAVMVGDSLGSDVDASYKATDGKIKGILISPGEKVSEGVRSVLEDVAIVDKIQEVPAAVHELVG